MLTFSSLTAKINAVAVTVIGFLIANPDVRHELIAAVPVAYQGIALLLFGVLVQISAEHDRKAAPPEAGK